MSILLTYTPAGQVTDGVIRLGFEGGTAPAFYAQRCGHAETCPGLGRYELLLLDGEGKLATLKGSVAALSPFGDTTPTFSLERADQAAFDMLTERSSPVSRAELRFIPLAEGVPTMARDVSLYFRRGIPGDQIALGYRLAKAGGFAPGEYGT